MDRVTISRVSGEDGKALEDSLLWRSIAVNATTVFVRQDCLTPNLA